MYKLSFSNIDPFNKVKYLLLYFITTYKTPKLRNQNACDKPVGEYFNPNLTGSLITFRIGLNGFANPLRDIKESCGPPNICRHGNNLFKAICLWKLLLLYAILFSKCYVQKVLYMVHWFGFVVLLWSF